MEMNKNKTTEIRLMGERISLRRKEDPSMQGMTEEIIQLVSERITEVEDRVSGAKTPHQITLLALLDLAEEYVSAKKRTENFKAEIEKRSASLLSRIEGSSENLGETSGGSPRK